MLANYHTHTTRCHHAVGTEREYIEAAIKQGFKILGFSDHTPQPYPDGFRSGIRMKMEELQGYVDTLSTLREEYKSKIEILIGLEVEYSENYFETLMQELRKYPLDYIILGQHFVPDEVYGFYTGEPTKSEDRLRAYVDTTIEGMRTGLFSYLAHPDLMNFTGRDDIYEEHMERLIDEAIELDIPLEINMYGFDDDRQYPCDRFFELAVSRGAKFVMGCDAHTPKLILQPEKMRGLPKFLKRHGIDTGDNIITLRDIR
jgi:histidinol-phosphatase (PHP family)